MLSLEFIRQLKSSKAQRIKTLRINAAVAEQVARLKICQQKTRSVLRAINIHSSLQICYNVLKWLIVAIGSSALKIKLPDTKTSAPASYKLRPVSKFTPPSTSIRQL